MTGVVCVCGWVEGWAGGVLVYVKKGIIVKRREDLETNEISCIRLVLTQAKRIILIRNLYRYPDSMIGYNNRFEDFVDKVSREGKELILKGDFNKSVCNDHCVTYWLHFMLFGGLSQLICHPTK